MAKICRICQVEKSDTEFYRDRRASSGLWSVCKMCSDERHKRYYIEHREKCREYGRNFVQHLKLKALLHYLNGEIKCAHCGFNDIRALSIDHINGGGHSHTKNLTETLYNWLRRNKYPEGFQVLCMNCQFIKKVENKEQHGSH